jgi:hypothetical protein
MRGGGHRNEWKPEVGHKQKKKKCWELLVWGTNRLRSLEHWDRGFESH